MSSSAVQAVFWDFGGVLTSSPFDAFARYEREAGLPADLIRTINATDPDDNAWARLERSESSVDQFAAEFEIEAAALGHRVDGHRVLACLAGELRPAMVRALDLVGEQHPCWCLTNNVRSGIGPGMAISSERAAEVDLVMARFTGVIESSVVGCRKPEPRFYEIALERAGVSPERVVYLDDLGVNLKPARAMGMRTVKVSDPERAIDELGELTGITVR